ncbi:alpha/beta fold hydrolase [Paenibacillus physcomitrellae]|uniref:Alpha/beta hydrolase n=1 Tax=Paenibacillus physcomitrellae TaxID=1619311 RepID=A0ABQ1GLF7_9BACL|nr:alpha/beta hydrolase [Paenibacillus physcomitrellae]GGA46140.1 alpha/beta hydrolase [Paenibacillus physcomitrellae]
MTVKYRFAKVKGLNIFYREAGSRENPTLLLLHGFPSSSHMFRNLIRELENEYHLIAPDYPGFGNSDQPSISEFTYTFDNLADLINDFVEQLNLNSYSLYVHDYGAPVGFRLASRHPERIQAIISQNGNAYEEGLEPAWDPIRAFWIHPEDRTIREKVLLLLTPELTKYQYVNGTRNPEEISPDTWNMDQMTLDRPGNADIQLALFYDYQNNLKQYPLWHDYFKAFQPPMLVAWGRNDIFFGPAGALAYQRDLQDTEVHLLNTGHFPLEEELELSVSLIQNFLAKRLVNSL